MNGVFLHLIWFNPTGMVCSVPVYLGMAGGQAMSIEAVPNTMEGT